MTYYRMFVVAAVACLFFACSKDKSAEKEAPANEDTTFLPVSTNSSWHYHDNSGLGGDFTLTATGKDTTINQQKFYIFLNKPDTSASSEEALFAQDENDYYVRGLLSQLGGNTLLYFKDKSPVNTQWTQNVSLDFAGQENINCTVNFTLANTNTTKQINGLTFKQVSEVTFEIKAITPLGEISVGSGSILIGMGVGILSLQLKNGPSVAADFSLDSYSIK